jgi:phage baseplate assembly protein W
MDAQVTPTPARLAIGALGLDEILQNVRVILTTPKGSLMGDREFGVDQAFLDTPTPKAKAAYMTSVVEAVQRYEPRARVTAISWKPDTAAAGEGRLLPVISLSIEEGA